MDVREAQHAKTKTIAAGGIAISIGTRVGEHELKGVPDRWRLYRSAD